MSTFQAQQSMKLIGICGPARSGKDTSADFMVEHYGFRRQAFADPLRDALTAMLGLSLVDFTDNKEIDLTLVGRSPRYLMQTLGTEWGRDMVNPNIWTRLASARLLQAGRAMTVFSDVRFENEAAWVRGCGGKVIFLERPSAPTVRKHVSETVAIPCPGDYTICNNGSLADLHKNLMRIMAAVGVAPLNDTASDTANDEAADKPRDNTSERGSEC